MAVSLPTSRLAILDYRFRSGSDLLSGDGASDIIYGMRGISNQSNHAYAYRVQTLTAQWATDGYLYETTSVTESTVFGPMTVEFGADVTTIRLVAYVDDVIIKLRVYDGTSTLDSTGTTQATPGTVTETRALGVTTGAVGRVEIRMRADTAPNTAKLYGFVIQEVALASGELP